VRSRTSSASGCPAFFHTRARRAQIRQLRHEQRLGEPKFERVKRRLDEVKSQQRGVEGTYRSNADMDRQRQLMADIAIEKQLEAQSAFRAQGTYLQGVVNQMNERKQQSQRLCAFRLASGPLRVCTIAQCLQFGGRCV
jgi:hypothetical protein